MTNTNGAKASIREVYKISQRLETKIDSVNERVSGLDKRFASMEGKVSVIAVIWSSIIAIVGIAVGVFIKR